MPALTPEQQALKQAALAATPGPWDFDTAETPYRIAGGEVVGGDALPYGDVYTVQEYETPEGSDSLIVTTEVGTANGRFIARANPAAILALLAQIEAMPDCPKQTPYGEAICGACMEASERDKAS